MSQRRPKPQRLDLVDAELIKETLRSPGWQLIKQGLEKMLQSKTRDLIRPQSEIGTAQLRGAIETIETILDVPQIMIREGTK